MTRRTEIFAADLAGTVIEPTDPNGVVMFCLAGGGMSRHYFDLHGADQAGTLSMGEHLAQRGFTVITLDHPGVGESPAGVDGWDLTPQYVAERGAAAVSELRRRYPGTAVGVGHSTGAMLAVIAQGRHRCFDALALLGWSFSLRFGLPELDAGLTDEERSVLGDAEAVRSHQVEFAKQKFSGPREDGNSTTWELLIGPTHISDQARAAIRQASAELLAVCGLAAVLRGVGPEVTAIDVPVFLA
jgi:pimeloyl-ACP methyl ester carboxylesterase